MQEAFKSGADPDQLAQLRIEVTVPKANPLLSIIDCFCNTEVSVRFTKAEHETVADSWLYVLEITGKFMDLNLVDMKFDEWRTTHKIPYQTP